ncbi:hypothetical protein RIR_jg5295.t1 [Rhizophagus irregularis DAOM 181602=DAOM 197198]|nr:hypothetical protein RIR_jg5295.t1 [Rhizophagus irregularis DAOM 181602=DAOM 197198]
MLKNDSIYEENLLGNRELLEYKYIIEDDEQDIRFAKFEEYDIGKLKSSDDVKESSSNDGDKHIKKIYINYWLENGYEIDTEEIR